jgi:hypothetical protein
VLDTNRHATEQADERVQPHSADSPFRLGTPYHDVSEDVIYRVVREVAVDPMQGWRTATFWLTRWKMPFQDFLVVIRHGWLDAAMVEGSAAKRYRCRDELRVLEWQASKVPLAPAARVKMVRRR